MSEEREETFKTLKEYGEFRKQAVPEVRKQLPSVARIRAERVGKQVGIDIKEKGKEAARTAVEEGPEIMKGGVGLAARVGAGILKGAGLITKLKGIKTEDQMIKNKHLYFMGEGLNPAFTPLGRTYDRHHPMELYFGRRRGRGVPEGAQTVYVALQQGYEVEQLEVITSLSPQQIMGAIQYLKEKRLWQEEWD